MLTCHRISLRKNGRSIFQDVSMQVPRAALSVIIGPNGAGKTSLLRCLAGLEAPGSGAVNLAGRPLATWSSRELAQQRAWCPERLSAGGGFRVAELVMLGRFPWHRGFPQEGDRQRVDEVLTELGMSDKAHQHVEELSSGELRKVMIARTLVQDTPLVLLDEPCANLDIAGSLQVMRVLKGRSRRGQTICLALHDLWLVRQFADVIVLLAGGKVRCTGECEGVFADAALAESYGVKIDMLHHQNRAYMAIDAGG